MTGQDAYKIISKQYPIAKVRGCLDYGNFFVFSLIPIYVNDDEEYFSGTVMDAVDKKTGKVFKYDISKDLQAYDRASPVSIKTIFDSSIN